MTEPTCGGEGSGTGGGGTAKKSVGSGLDEAAELRTTPPLRPIDPLSLAHTHLCEHIHGRLEVRAREHMGLQGDKAGQGADAIKARGILHLARGGGHEEHFFPGGFERRGRPVGQRGERGPIRFVGCHRRVHLRNAPREGPRQGDPVAVAPMRAAVHLHEYRAVVREHNLPVRRPVAHAKGVEDRSRVGDEDGHELRVMHRPHAKVDEGCVGGEGSVGTRERATTPEPQPWARAGRGAAHGRVQTQPHAAGANEPAPLRGRLS